MRPVTVNNNPAYQVPATMTTYKAAIKNGLAAWGVNPVSGTSTFSTPVVLALLEQLTFQNAGAAKWANLNAISKSLVTSLIQYFTENNNMKYGNARGSLIDNYGQYCSYCGTPVQDTALAIEHCLPKAEFPSQMLLYTNFFLCCPSCNSYKGSEPSYQVCYNWAVQFNNPPNIQQILAGGFNRQLWPNNGNIAWTGFIPFLQDVTNGQPIGAQNARNLNNTLVGVTQNTVQANIAGYNNPITIASQFQANYNNPILQHQETNFMNIVQINTFQSGVYSDRRVTNRTVAWLNVLSSVRNLNQFQAGSGLWNLMLAQIYSTAKNAGFFEIWSLLLYFISPPNVGQYSVYLLFRTASTDPNQPLYYFTGTNAAALPTQ